MAYEQYKVQPYYDSLVAKLVVTGANREIAMQRAAAGAERVRDRGDQDQHPLPQAACSQHPGFVAGQYDTRIVDQILNPPVPAEAPSQGRARDTAEPRPPRRAPRTAPTIPEFLCGFAGVAP